MCHCFMDVLPGCPAARTVRHGVSGCVTAQRGALAAPPNGNCLNATALQKKLYSARVKARHSMEGRFTPSVCRIFPLYKRPRVSRAEYMSAKQRLAASATGHVGPGHGRRRAFGMPDRGHGRDTEVAESDSAVMRRDLATGPTARDPATSPTARDGPDGTRSGDGRYRTRRHIPVAVPCDGPYGTRQPSRTR